MCHGSFRDGLYQLGWSKLCSTVLHSSWYFITDLPSTSISAEFVVLLVCLNYPIVSCLLFMLHTAITIQSPGSSLYCAQWLLMCRRSSFLLYYLYLYIILIYILCITSFYLFWVTCLPIVHHWVITRTFHISQCVFFIRLIAVTCMCWYCSACLQVKDFWELNITELLSSAQELKERGTYFFQVEFLIWVTLSDIRTSNPKQLFV